MNKQSTVLFPLPKLMHIIRVGILSAMSTATFSLVNALILEWCKWNMYIYREKFYLNKDVLFITSRDISLLLV